MDLRRSVLIVDDDDTLRATLEKIFAKAGYEALTARDADEAVAVMRAEGARLVLADLKMPRRDGLSLLDEIRQARPDSRVIIMTAYGTEDTHEDAIRRGAFAYLSKPVSRAELLDLCEKAFEDE
jgi:DNA-binding NtrC family response regulator